MAGVAGKVKILTTVIHDILLMTAIQTVGYGIQLVMDRS
jgi:hypothetical protein